MRRIWLDEMTWEEAAKAFGETDVAVVCCGATHPHGLACPLGTDTFVAQGMAERIGKKANVIVIPTVSFGYNEHHMDWPGTIHIQKHHLFGIYMDICKSLHKWGIRKLVFLSPHTGNSSIIEDVAYRLRYRKGMLSAFVSYELAEEANPRLKEYLHSEGLVDEASMMLHLRPDIVHPGRAKFKDFKNVFGPGFRVVGLKRLKVGKVTFQVYTTSKDVTENCEWGASPKAIDMTNASRELGKEIVETAVDCIVKFIEEFKKVEIPPTSWNVQD